jgi:hypothetical protein
MNATVESVLETALKLSDEERELIYLKLGDTLYQPKDEGDAEISNAMKGTLDRRWEEIESGKVKCEDAFVVLERLRGKLNV